MGERFNARRRARRRQSDRGMVTTTATRRDTQRGQCGMPALRRAHADGRKALHQLHVVVAEADGLFEVGRLQVLIEIDKCLFLAGGEMRPRRQPRRLRLRGAYSSGLLGLSGAAGVAPGGLGRSQVRRTGQCAGNPDCACRRRHDEVFPRCFIAHRGPRMRC